MAPGSRLRDDLQTLPVYVPGARGGHAAFKLSSNENPFPPLPAVLTAVADAAADLNRYPDMAASELTTALSETLGVPPDWLVLGNGSVAVLETLMRAACRPGEEIVFAWRSFEAYPIAVHVAGATAVHVPLREDGGHDLAAMAAAITPATRAVLLCSPNNPTGPVLRHDEVVDFLNRVPPHVLVVLDEAYLEFITDPQAADGLTLLAEHDNLVLLRTFSKAHGLAGLRVGYAVAHPDIVGGLRAAATPFGVNALAQAAALAALRERATIAERCAEIITKRDRITQDLAGQGWQVPETQGNFYWLPLGPQSADFAEQAAARGALVRAFAEEGVRVSVGEDEANDIIAGLIAEWPPS